MGWISKRTTDVAELAAQTEERFAAALHEDFDSALAVLQNVRHRARSRAAELTALSHVVNKAAKYLKENFSHDE